jgi:predicted nucleic acid-binding protein
MSSVQSGGVAPSTDVKYVIDANVVIQIAISGGDLGPLHGHQLVAPPLIRSEALSALSELVYRGEIPEDAAVRAIHVIAGLPIELERPDALDVDAWNTARSLGWAKTYDAEYVVLSRMLDLPLVTLDERLRRGAGHLVAMPRPTELV